MASKRRKSAPDKGKKALGVVLFLVALLLLISLISHGQPDDARIVGEVDSHLNPFQIKFGNQAGMLGAYLSYLLLGLVGWLAFFLPLGLIYLSLRMFSSELATRLELNSLIIFTVSLLATMIYNIHLLVPRTLSRAVDLPGGIIAEYFTVWSLKVVGELGSYIVLSGLILILLILFSSLSQIFSLELRLPKTDAITDLLRASWRSLAAAFSFKWVGSLFERRSDSNDDDEFAEDEADSPEYATESTVAASDKPKIDTDRPSPTRGKRRTTLVKPAEPLQIKSIEYSYPTLDLLKDNPNEGASVQGEELTQTARALCETLETFGVSIDGNIEKFPGPVITRYEFKPASGIKINQIINLSDDLALALKAKRIRIIAPIPGKAAVGVEIPNRNAQTVYLKDILTSEAYSDKKAILPLALGKTTAGRPYVCDLTKLPHLLIAGATGSGKSVCINVVVTSLLYRLHPHQVRFIMIDPKMLELSIYAGIPHLARPVVTKPKRAERVLAEAVAEMEKRYRKLANASVRNIEDFNAKQDNPEQQLPYIVIMVDELADMLMSSSSSRTELLITRLAQMARAVGIHLILATQRPSVDVITGLIKANFPARMAFQVSSKVDSRTIIDGNGAEKLLGNGDMLFLYPGQPEPIRIHGAYVRSEETTSIVEAINAQGLEMFALEGISQTSGDTTEREVDFGDPLFKEACEVVVRHKQGSVSLLQRRLGIGYQRAARLIDKLEGAGIVSTFDGSKAREVMVDKVYIDNLFAQAGGAVTTDSGQNS
ncbi:MAG: DNA translocase FtsK 4TM domain-containing protein [candidate division Zixibacteria bacterium]|nr:DNA translocase FtsK 4TM domain-containing protein [candidate division Zixibacteria bacterium]